MDIRSKHSYFVPPPALLLAILLCFTSLFCSNSYAGESSKIAVVYPDIREPYLSVFKEIKAGIDQSLNSPADTIVIDKKTTAASLNAQLDEANIGAVITLGSGAYQFAEQLANGRKFIGGAVFTRPEPEKNSVSSISMIVAPKLQFQQLKEIAPEIKTIHVIYNAELDQWLIDRARIALKDTGIKLDAIATTSLKDKAMVYQQLLENEQLSSNDALWLLQGDRVSSENTVLSQILQRSWEQHFVVFSANPSHVKRGALFATYPNNIQLGETLGKSIAKLNEETLPVVTPLSDVNVAFNSRTAEHLKLNISRSQKASFDLVFPNR